MRAIDTNIVVRFLTGDDPAQFALARQVIEHETVFVPVTVILETAWVLRSKGVAPATVIDSLRNFAGLPTIVIERESAVADALDLAGAGVDFADALHLVALEDCSAMLTFDRNFARRSAGRHPVIVTLLNGETT